jgi:hypothetical protein
MTLRELLNQLTTLADNRTPSQRKIWGVGAGIIALAMGIAHIALAAWSVHKGHPFTPLEFGTGGAALLTILVALPMSLAKAMQILPDTTCPPGEGGEA